MLSHGWVIGPVVFTAFALILDQFAEQVGLEAAAQLVQGLFLQLTGAFAGDAEELADFLQGQPFVKAENDNLLFPLVVVACLVVVPYVVPVESSWSGRCRSPCARGGVLVACMPEPW